MRPIPLHSGILVGLALSLLSGCNYIHFGRYAPPSADTSALTAANTDLRVENKILRQEIALVRKEKDALRQALEKQTAASDDPNALTAQVSTTTAELGALRANYARLQEELNKLRSAPAGGSPNLADTQQIASLRTQLGATRDELAQTQGNRARLQQENEQLRQEVDRSRQENDALARQVQSLARQNEQVTHALSQLNTELLAQKRATPAPVARAQPPPPANAAAQGAPVSLADMRQSTAASARQLDATLLMAKPGENGSPVTVELHANTARLQETAAAPDNSDRYYEVVDGDTLESIALKFYQRAERWRVIYAANNELLRGGRPIRPGMKLLIPEP